MQGDAISQTELIAQLRTDLEAERAARQTLEVQVKKISERLNTLSTTMFAMVRRPSESRSQERLAQPSGGGSSPLLLPPKTLPVPLPTQEQHSVFESDDDDDNDEEDEDDDDATEDATTALESGTPTRLSQPITSKAKTEVLEEGEVTEDDFQTPMEKRTPMVGCGAFGEELRVEDVVEGDEGNDCGHGGDGDEEESRRRKAARTLSLSQLTLGKGQRTRI